MNRSKKYLLLAGSIGVVATFLMASTTLVAHSPAVADQTNEKVAGIIAIVKGQTARLNLVNIGDPSITPDPCRGTLDFFDGAGNLLTASTQVSLEVGQATFADLNADTIAFRGRLSLRGVARFPPFDPTLPNACATTHLTLEIIDNNSLQTTALAPEPHLQDPPDPDKHFGMVGITQSQGLRLNVVNLGEGSVTPEPCVATLRFLDANGREAIDPVVLTLPTRGGSGFADLLAGHGIIINDKSRLELRGVVTFPPLRDPTAPNACGNIRASVEAFDAKTGQTTIFYGGPDTSGQ
jgi:hypothetical protein